MATSPPRPTPAAHVLRAPATTRLGTPLGPPPADGRYEPVGGAGSSTRAVGDRAAVAVADPEAATIWVEAAPLVEHGAPGAARLATAVVVAGGAGVWLCVTILKYLHELIEAARAIL